MFFCLAGFGRRFWPGISTDLLEAYNCYKLARLTYTQPWVLWNEPFSDWWGNRVLMFNRIDKRVEAHMRQHQQ